MTMVPQKVWVCTVCGYIHYGPNPPDECPNCGALREDFVEETPAAAAETSVQPEANAPRIVIIGAGIAGVTAAEESRKAAPQAQITLISAEPDWPYFRMSLTRYIAGQTTADKLELHPQSWYAEQRIDLRRGALAVSIDPDQRTVSLSSGEILPYDALVLTVGSRPFVPPLAGAALKNVFSLRTRQDAETLLKLSRGTELVCIGGGVLGLEAAAGLARQGARVTVLEAMDWLLPRQLTREASRIFTEYVEGLGIQVRGGVKVKALEGEEAVRAVLLEDGTRLPAQVVLFSAGVRSTLDLAKQAGLSVNQGILVDDAMRTSRPEIFAAGDAVEHQGVLYGTWGPAKAQGAVAGASAGGQEAAFHPIPRSVILKVLGIDLFSTGKIAPAAGDALVERSGASLYHGFVFEEGKLVGAILLGDASASAQVKQAVETRLDCSALLQTQPDAAAVLEYLKANTPA